MPIPASPMDRIDQYSCEVLGGKIAPKELNIYHYIH